MTGHRNSYAWFFIGAPTWDAAKSAVTPLTIGTDILCDQLGGNGSYVNNRYLLLHLASQLAHNDYGLGANDPAESRCSTVRAIMNASGPLFVVSGPLAVFLTCEIYSKYYLWSALNKLQEFSPQTWLSTLMEGPLHVMKGFLWFVVTSAIRLVTTILFALFRPSQQYYHILNKTNSVWLARSSALLSLTLYLCLPVLFIPFSSLLMTSGVTLLTAKAQLITALNSFSWSKDAAYALAVACYPVIGGALLLGWIKHTQPTKRVLATQFIEAKYTQEHSEEARTCYIDLLTPILATIQHKNKAVDETNDALIESATSLRSSTSTITVRPASQKRKNSYAEIARNSFDEKLKIDLNNSQDLKALLGNLKKINWEPHHQVIKNTCDALTKHIDTLAKESNSGGMTAEEKSTVYTVLAKVATQSCLSDEIPKRLRINEKDMPVVEEAIIKIIEKKPALILKLRTGLDAFFADPAVCASAVSEKIELTDYKRSQPYQPYSQFIASYKTESEEVDKSTTPTP